MSQDGQCWPAPADRPRVVVAVFPMEPGACFDWHVHEDHQLAWASNGVLTVVTGEQTFVLPPTRALFIPAGVGHETKSAGVATMRTLYIRPDQSLFDWAQPTPVVAGLLLAELIGYLEGEALDGPARARAEEVIFDLISPMSTTAIEIRMPKDPRALDVAREIIANPADARDLSAWGTAVGASARTLARAFLETGVTFGHWRTRARLQAAAPMLANGAAVSRVAYQVGYSTTSAFVAAFKRETGLTPGKYFAPESADLSNPNGGGATEGRRTVSV